MSDSDMSPTVYKPIAGYEGHRISATGIVESCLCPTPGKRAPWQPGTVWRPLSILKSRQSNVLMVSLRANGRAQQYPVKRLLYTTFIGPVGATESIKCRNDDESDLSLTNLQVVPGRYIRRTTLYRDNKK